MGLEPTTYLHDQLSCDYCVYILVTMKVLQVVVSYFITLSVHNLHSNCTIHLIYTENTMKDIVHVHTATY